jgi:hypothetical protein
MKYAYFVKRTRCEINDFSIVFSAKTVSWTSFTLRFYQLCGDFLQVIHWQFSRWLRLKIASRRVERDRGPGFTNRHFVPGPRGWLSPALQPTDQLTHWSTEWPTDQPANWLMNWPTDPLTNRLTNQLTKFCIYRRCYLQKIRPESNWSKTNGIHM